MDIPSGVLKTTMRPGGLEKESVMTYLDELNSKINDLEDELKKKEENPEESGLIKQYRQDLETAERKASEAEKKASDSAAQLKSLTDKATQLANALNAEKEARNNDAKKMKQLLQQAQNNSVEEEKIRSYQQEILSLKTEIGHLTNENASLKATANSSDQLSETVQKLNQELTEKSNNAAGLETKLADTEAKLKKTEETVSDKDAEIAELKHKVSELEQKASQNTGFAPSFDMSAIFAQAQQSAVQLEMQAKAEAEKTVSDANALAEKTVSEANAQAEKTVNDANAQAEKTINDANTQAETTINDANAQADRTVTSANAEAERILKNAEERSAASNAEADAILSGAKEKAQIEATRIKKDAIEQQQKVKQLTATIKSVLTIEIDGIEKSLREASTLMNQASKVMDEKIKAADEVIADARDCVEKNAKVEEDTMEDIMSKPVSNQAPKYHASSQNNGGVKPAMKPEKKNGGFAFDMSELIKDAEASVTE